MSPVTIRTPGPQELGRTGQIDDHLPLSQSKHNMHPFKELFQQCFFVVFIDGTWIPQELEREAASAWLCIDFLNLEQLDLATDTNHRQRLNLMTADNIGSKLDNKTLKNKEYPK